MLRERSRKVDQRRRDFVTKGVAAAGIAWVAPVVLADKAAAAAVGSALTGCLYCFDDGTSEGWTLDGMWNISSDRSVSPSFSLHYGTGIGGNYDTPGSANSGSSVSPTFTVPTVGSTLLEFELWREVEVFASGTWDEFSVTVLPDGTTIYAVSRDGGTGGVFEHITLDLAAWAGQDIQLSFAFDTGDDNFNDFEGIYVDDILVPGDCPTTSGSTSLSLNRSAVSSFVPPRREVPLRERLERDQLARRSGRRTG